MLGSPGQKICSDGAGTVTVRKPELLEKAAVWEHSRTEMVFGKLTHIQFPNHAIAKQKCFTDGGQRRANLPPPVISAKSGRGSPAAAAQQTAGIPGPTMHVLSNQTLDGAHLIKDVNVSAFDARGLQQFQRRGHKAVRAAHVNLVGRDGRCRFQV